MKLPRGWRWPRFGLQSEPYWIRRFMARVQKPPGPAPAPTPIENPWHTLTDTASPRRRKTDVDDLPKQ